MKMTLRFYRRDGGGLVWFPCFSREASVFFVREPSDRLESCFCYNFSIVPFSESDWRKKNLLLRLFQIPTQELVAELCVWCSHVQLALAFCWADTEGRSERKGGGEAAGKGNGRFLSSVFKCLFHSTCSSSSSAHAQPHKGASSTLLMMAERIIGYAHHRRKPFCLALIPSGSFTFWRIEKNELKIRIISLIWLHLRFMAAAFKGNWKKPTAEFTSVPFLVFQYFINVTSKVNLWGH